MKRYGKIIEGNPSANEYDIIDIIPYKIPRKEASSDAEIHCPNQEASYDLEQEKNVYGY